MNCNEAVTRIKLWADVEKEIDPHYERRLPNVLPEGCDADIEGSAEVIFDLIAYWQTQECDVMLEVTKLIRHREKEQDKHGRRPIRH